MGEVLWVFVLGGGEDGLGRWFEKNAYFDSTDERGRVIASYLYLIGCVEMVN